MKNLCKIVLLIGITTISMPTSVFADLFSDLVQAMKEKRLTVRSLQDQVTTKTYLKTDTDSYGATLLHHAAQHITDPELIQEFLAQGFDRNKQDSNGATPMHWAVGNKNPEAVKALITPKTDKAPATNLNQQDAKGWTPLHIAIEQIGKYGLTDDLQTILDALLFNANGDPNAQPNIENNSDPGSKTPIDMAIALPEKLQGRQDVLNMLLWSSALNLLADSIEQLISAGAQINSQHEQTGNTALHWVFLNTTKADKLPTIQKLLNNNPDLTIKDKNGYTPLHLAVSQADLPAAQAILEKAQQENVDLLAITSAENKTPYDLAQELTGPEALQLQKYTKPEVPPEPPKKIAEEPPSSQRRWVVGGIAALLTTITAIAIYKKRETIRRWGQRGWQRFTGLFGKKEQKAL